MWACAYKSVRAMVNNLGDESHRSSMPRYSSVCWVCIRNERELWDLHFHRMIAETVSNLTRERLASLEDELQRVKRQREAPEPPDENHQAALAAVEKHATEQKEHFVTLRWRTTLEVARRGALATMRYNTVMAQAIVSLRKDLGLPIDETFYRNLTERSQKETLSHLEDAIAHMERVSESGKPPPPERHLNRRGEKSLDPQ
jgi:hypothetical protein